MSENENNNLPADDAASNEVKKATEEAETRELGQQPTPTEKKEPKKVFTFLTTAVISLVAVVLTFMITYISVTNSMLAFRRDELAKYNDEINYYKEQLELLKDKNNINNMVLGKLVTDEQRKKLFEQLYELDETFRKYEFNQMDYEAITDYVLTAYAASIGDLYAEYYNEENFAAMLSSMQGQNQGIGVNVAYDAVHEAIGVINVMPNSPALNAGVKPGDSIIAVGKGDQKELVSEIGYTAAMIKMQGAKGTYAEFTVLRDGKEIDFSILRDEYVNQSVVWHVYTADSSVAVLRIFNFDGKTAEQFKNAMTDIERAGIKKVIFDVRANPGGTLNSIVEILDYLLPGGPIVRIVDKTGKVVESQSSANSASHKGMKFVVIANENTASAAELFTSALMDYERATFVGTKTFGKGSMQSTLTLSGDRGVKMTTYHYLPPYSPSYDGIGIVPDVNVPLDDAIKDKNIFLLTDEEDNQLREAVAVINK